MKRRTKPFNFCLVDTETGIGRAFCSTRCLVSWLRWWKEKIGDRYHLGYPTNQVACQHCWLCGNRTGFDGPCIVHDEGCCPEQDWSYTYICSAMAPIVSQVLTRPLEDHDFHVMSEVYEEREPTDYPWDLAMKAVDLIREGSG